MARIDLSLSRITKLLAHLPQPTWKAVHIAGTNGKGSVAAYLTTLIRRNGLLYEPSQRNPDRLGNEAKKRNLQHDLSELDSSSLPQEFNVGRFTSPHFIDRWDCITINNRAVSKDTFLAVENEVREKANNLHREMRESSETDQNGDVNQGLDANTITPFELLTATAFSIFTRAKVHVAIIECGLGGRLDATNAMQDLDIALSVITRIGLDHVNLLGNTIEEIAKEKAGILRRGVPVLVDDQNDESVKAVIRAQAEIRNAGEVEFVSWQMVKGCFSQNQALLSQQAGKSGITAVENLLPHQRTNWAIAVTALRALLIQLRGGHSGSHLSCSAVTAIAAYRGIQAGLLEEAHKSYPGRLQTLSPSWTRKITQSNLSSLENAYVLVDGAHNAQSATVLRQFVDRLVNATKHEDSASKILWILAVSQGKDFMEILRILVGRDDDLVLCEFGPVDGMPWVRPNPATALADSTRESYVKPANIDTCSDILEALNTVKPRVEAAQNQRIKPHVVVAGSLYLASDLLRLIRDGSSQQALGP